MGEEVKAGPQYLFATLMTSLKTTVRQSRLHPSNMAARVLYFEKPGVNNVGGQGFIMENGNIAVRCESF